MRRILAATGFALVIVASSCGGTDTKPPIGNFAASIETGTPAKFASILRSLRGKPVVVNFWATWCAPCKKEMPLLAAAAKRYEGRVEFLGVNVQDDPDAAVDFVRRYRIPFRNLADRRGDIRRKEKILGLPVTQFYNVDGEAGLISGELRSKELEENIQALLVKRAN